MTIILFVFFYEHSFKNIKLKKNINTEYDKSQLTQELRGYVRTVSLSWYFIFCSFLWYGIFMVLRLLDQLGQSCTYSISSFWQITSHPLHLFSVGTSTYHGWVYARSYTLQQHFQLDFHLQAGLGYSTCVSTIQYLFSVDWNPDGVQYTWPTLIQHFWGTDLFELMKITSNWKFQKTSQF